MKLLKKIFRIFNDYGLKVLIFRILGYFIKHLKIYFSRDIKNYDSYQKFIKEIETHNLDIKINKSLSVSKFYPKFSIIIPVYNVDKKWLVKCIDSVLNQSYQNWQLCLADDNSSYPHVKTLLNKYAASDQRINVVFRSSNGHISDASNSALAIAEGDYICLMDNDDEIAQNALLEFALLLNKDPSIDMIYRRRQA